MLGCDNNMASSVIHMVVANEINKTLKRDNDKLLIGAIAPDLSKQIGQTKIESHFLDNDYDEIPNLDRFLDKYKDNLSDDFVLGYFIHLYTDYLWFKYFIPEISSHNYITKLDGTVVKCNGKMLRLYMYNDYTNLNIQLIEQYNLDVDILYNDLPEIKKIIDEIPMERLKLITTQAAAIIENSKQKKDLIFNIDNINRFIDMNIELITAKLLEMGLL